MNESLKILNGQSEAVNRRTDNTIAKKRSKRQTMVDTSILRVLLGIGISVFCLVHFDRH
jgi:hypothetical protein